MNIHKFNPEMAVNTIRKTDVNKAALKEKYLKNLESETQNMEFHAHSIEFYPEDIEKMKNMSIAEENAYKLRLKFNNRYIIPDYSVYMA